MKDNFQLSTVNSQLPKGWEVKKLGEVCEIRSGRNQKDVLNPNGKYPILGSSGKVMGYADKFICDEGTTIVGRKGTIDKPLFIKTKFWNVDTAFGLVAKDIMHKKFLFYFCKNFNFKELDKGTTLPSLVKKDLVKIQIPIPPLPEQQRIVKILDKAFVAIDKAKQNAEQNLRNAKEVFQSKLQSIFDNGKLKVENGEWKEKTFKELSSRIGDGLHGTPKYDENGDYYFINGNNLNDGVIEIKESTKKVNKEEFEKHKRGMNQNTVLISINGTLGKVAFYNGEPVILGKSACYINFNDEVNKYYIKYLVISPVFFKNMARVSTGATIKNFSLKSMRNYSLHLPSIQEQKCIVVQLDRLQEKTKHLEEIYQQKLDNLAELKKSILQKAFEGRL